MENLNSDKQALEKQRNEAVQNLDEMTKSMNEFRSHAKQKLDRCTEDEEGLKKQLRALASELEDLRASLLVKEKCVNEKQTQLEDFKQLTESKDSRIHDLMERLESLNQENELLKESSTITSTALSDVKIELETLKREHANSLNDQTTKDIFYREISELKQQLAARDLEISALKLSSSRSANQSCHHPCDRGFFTEKGVKRSDPENIAEPDLHDYSAMETERGKLRKQVRDLESALKSKTTELESVKSQLSLWSSQYDEAKNFINANDCLVMRLERDNQQKQNLLESSRKELNSLKVKMEDAKNEIITLEGKLKRSQMEFHQLTLSYNESVCNVDSLGKKLTHKQQVFEEKEFEYQSHIDQLREELKGLTANFEALANTVESKERTIKELQDHFDVMLPNLESVKAELTSLNSAHGQLKDQSRHIQDEKRRQIKHLESALKVYKEEIDKLNSILSSQKEDSESRLASASAEIEALKSKNSNYDRQLETSNKELQSLDLKVKELDNEVKIKTGKIEQLELSISQTLKEKSEILDKNSKDTSDFEKRYEDLNEVYKSVNKELIDMREKMALVKESLDAKTEKVAGLEDRCKDNDAKMKGFIEQIEQKSQKLLDEEESKKKLSMSIDALQEEVRSKNNQILSLTKNVQIADDKCKAVDRSFSDYYRNSQEIINHNKMLTDKVAELQDSLLAMQRLSEGKKDELTQAGDQISVLQGLLSEKQVSGAAKQQKILELEHALQVATKEKDIAIEKCKECNSRFETLVSKHQEFEHKLKVLEGQNIMKDDQIAMREDKIALLTSKLESIVKLDDSNLKKLEEVTRNASEKSEEIVKIKMDNAKLREQVASNESELSKMYRKNSDLEEKVKKFGEEVLKLNLDKKSLSEELNVKASNVDSLMTKVEKFETRENKLQVAVTDEISRLKNVVQTLTEEHNKEMSSQQENFNQIIAAKEEQLKRALHEAQQFTFREQILRNDLATAMNELGQVNQLNNVVYRSGFPHNMPKELNVSPTEYTSGVIPISDNVATVGYVTSEGSEFKERITANGAMKDGGGYFIYPVASVLGSSKFSALTGTTHTNATQNQAANRPNINGMDKALEIKSDPMLYNFHFLPPDQNGGKDLFQEMNSTSSGQVSPSQESIQRSVASQASDRLTSSAASHQTVKRTYSDNPRAHLVNSHPEKTDAALPVFKSSNTGASSVRSEPALRYDVKRESGGNVSETLPNGSQFGREKRSYSIERIHIPDNRVFRVERQIGHSQMNAPVNNKMKTYTVPLATDDRSTKAASNKDDDRFRKTSVQELSLVYNSEDELLNQSCTSLTSSAMTENIDGVVSTRSETPATNVDMNALNQDLSSFDIDADRVGNSTETDDDFIRILDDNSRKRRELEEKLNLLVEKTSGV